ncbi:hypothetical protein Tco_0053372 [Tanacetum coccineum]
MKATKKSKIQKTDADLEEEEQLKAYLKIVLNEEGIIDYEVLEKRSNGSSRWIKTFSEMVTRFDRLDLVEFIGACARVAIARFSQLPTHPVQALRPDEAIVCNRDPQSALVWQILVSYVYTLDNPEDGTEIHMLAEKKYPLIKETLERMLSLRLVARTASEDAYTLLRFIQKHIDEYGSHDGGEKDL